MYSANHICVETNDSTAVIGLSEYALKALKSIVFVNLPDAGDKLNKGDTFGDIESIKTVSELIAPFECTVCEVNEELYNNPELLEQGAWLIKVSDVGTEWQSLMTQEQYCEYTEKL